MYVSLLVIGILLAAGGLVTVGFGIPINAFSLGNTLIIAGAVSVTGGLILIGLAAAVRQLGRIAESLQAGRPLPQRIAKQAEAAVEAALVPPPPAARMPQPPAPPPAPLAPSPVPTRAAAPRPPETGMPRPFEQPAPLEPRFQAAAPDEPPARGPLDWLRPRAKGASAEPPVVELADEAPLSPRPAVSPLATMAEPVQEPRAWAPRVDESHDVRPEPKLEPKLEPKFQSRLEPRLESRSGGQRPDQVARVAPTAPRETRLFDVMWPDVRPSRTPEVSKAGKAKPAAARFAEAEPAESAQPEVRPAEAVRAEPREGNAPAAAPVARAAVRREREPAAKPAPEPVPGPASERPVAILKSGVIDSMAYTLYADGSIEAELPEGKVRFGSVDALRAHLEKNG